jgi:DHA3 family macrolide efflux protein-like MFS transporter
MRNHSFRYLVAGQSLANGGDLFYVVALMTLLYELSQSALYMTMIPFVVTISRFVCGLFVPILLDRYKLKSLLWVSQLWKTVLLFLLGIFVAFLVTKESLLFIFLFVSLISFLDGVAHPARNAMIPRLVKEGELVRANSILAVIDQTLQFGGWALGGVMAAFLSPSQIIWFTFVLFIVSTICMLKVEEVETGNKEHNVKRTGWLSIKEGWTYIFANRWLKKFHTMILLESMAGAVWIAAILYIYVEKTLKADPSWWGYINASFFAGLILGGIVVWKFSKAMQRRMFLSVCVGYFGTSLMTFVFGMNTVAWLSLSLSFGYGLFEQLKAIGLQTSLQENVAPSILPKIYAAQQVIMTLSFGLMSLLFGGLADIYGTKTVFMISSSLLCFAGLICFTMVSNLHAVKERQNTI